MLREAIAEIRDTAEATLEVEGAFSRAVALIVETLAAGGTIFACGNGGSAAEAQHFVTELVGRYKSNRQPLPAVWLGGDTAQMSCIANDFSADEVFSRPLAALARDKDLLLVLSTSGRSPNIVRCLDEAAKRGVKSVALLGKSGGSAARSATVPVVVPSASTARVQEMHLLMVHAICDAIEARFPET